MSSALGYPGRLDVAIVQQITLLRGSEQVAMSKRAGEIVPLDEILDEVGVDAARFFFIMLVGRVAAFIRPGARGTKGRTRIPVYYVQYGHARIASVLRRARPNDVRRTRGRPSSRRSFTDRARARAPAVRISQRRGGRRRTPRPAPPGPLRARRGRGLSPVLHRVQDPDRRTRGRGSARLALCFASKSVLARTLALARRQRAGFDVASPACRAFSRHSGCSACSWPRRRCAPESTYTFVDRLRDALILGVAIPLVLGLVHTLYPAACWAALALCVAVALARHVAGTRNRKPSSPTPYVLVAALAAVTWPQLMRPLLDGDSLSYHLPNAAAWAHTHSLWTTGTRYWWYPPASELFASAVYSVSGPFALPWTGVGALALLGFRIAGWARDSFAAPPLLADALAAATVTAYPIAIQGATLQNDVWLAAFWLESLWAIRDAPLAASRTIAITALIKPQGWLLAAIALIARKAPARLWLAAGGALALWALHDALLWRGASIAPASTMYGSVAGSTILAHGAPAIALLGRVAVGASPFALFALCASFLGPADRRSRSAPRVGGPRRCAALPRAAVRLRHVGCAARDRRFAAIRRPGDRAGAVLLALPARRFTVVATTLLARVHALRDMVHSGNLLERRRHACGDPRRGARRRVCRRGPAGAGWMAQRARLRNGGRRRDASRGSPPARLLRRRTSRRGQCARRLRLDRPRETTCDRRVGPAPRRGQRALAGNAHARSGRRRARAQAARDGVLLVAVAQSDRSNASNAQRLHIARSCGQLVYADAIGVVTAPNGLP